MYTEYSIVDDGGQAQVVKYFRTVAPDSDGAVFSYTFVVESIHLSNLTTLMVTSNQCDSVRISYLDTGTQSTWLAGIRNIRGAITTHFQS